jgi:hypothetical protein
VKRRYAVQGRDFSVRPCATRKAARIDQAANGGLVVTRKGTGVWTPYRPLHWLPRLLSPRTGDTPEDDGCLARIRLLRNRFPGLVFDVDRNGGTATYIIILPGRAEPFQSGNICALVAEVETWLSVEHASRLLGGDPWRPDNN